MGPARPIPVERLALGRAEQVERPIALLRGKREQPFDEVGIGRENQEPFDAAQDRLRGAQSKHERPLAFDSGTRPRSLS